MPTSSFDSKNPNRNKNFQMDSFPVYFVPSKSKTRYSPLRTLFSAHKFLYSALLGTVFIGLFYVWKLFDFPGAETLIHWIHEISAGILILIAIVLWSIFYQQHKVRRALARNQNPKMELTAVSSKIIIMSPYEVEETPVYIASESLSIDYWVSRETMMINDEDLTMGNLPDEYIAPDALVLTCHDKN